MTPPLPRASNPDVPPAPPVVASGDDEVFEMEDVKSPKEETSAQKSVRTRYRVKSVSKWCKGLIEDFFFRLPIRSYSLARLVDKNEIGDVTLLVSTELPVNGCPKYVRIIIRFTTVTIIQRNTMSAGLWIIESTDHEPILPGKCEKNGLI